MEPEKILDAYIHDYLVKRKYNATSKTFQAEAAVSNNINVIDTPGGFLFEWWSVFWDVFVARNKPQVPGVVSYNEAQIIQEQEKQQQWHPKSLRQQQQGEDLLLQREIQKQLQFLQQREDTQPQHRTASDTRARQQRISNLSPTKMYQEGLRLPIPNDPLNDANMMPRFGDNMGHILYSNDGTTLKSLAGQSRYAPYATSGGISGSLHPTKNAGFTNMPLRGWPLMGVDQLRPRLLQPQQPPMQSPQASHQFQLQRQFMLQAQQKLPLSSVNNSEGRKVRMLNEQNVGSGKDGIISTGDTVSNDCSLVQIGHPVLSRGDIDMLFKQQQMQGCHEHQQQYQQGALLNKQSQTSNYHLHKQDNMVGAGSIAAEGSLSSTTRGNDQASKNRTGQKKKCPMSSSGSANSSGTGSTTGPSPSSAPSTPSSPHTLGNVSSTPTLPHSKGFSQSACMFGNNGGETLASAANQSAQMDCFASDRSLDDNVDTFLSNDDAFRGVDTSAGSTFSEIGSFHANQVDYCHLSSDGKLLVTGGNDKKAYLWCTDLMEQKCMFEEHSHAITDSRFSPTMPWLATSSLDKTVRVWDVENPDYSLRTFVGHSGSVMSLDFHPKGDLICSCDGKNEIRYWSIKKGGCARVLQGSSTQVRFQPSFGRYIAAVAGSSISIVDVETAQTCGNPLKSHALNVQSVCWDFSGELLASLSEDLIRVWKIGSGARRDCIRELSFSAKKFRCCVFHPHYPSLLVIGCSQSLELWNIAENKMMSAVKEPISALAVSETTGLVASASEDNDVKMWKWI